MLHLFLALALLAQPAPATPAAVGPADQPQTSSEPKPDAKWDVANPPTDGSLGGWGWQEANLDVTEGTWMSLDVSPDGRTIVFDLLGDLYTMPIDGSADGSQVKCIAEGLQWDMQPRFSPDGRWIAFVSDRTGDNGKGGDNIWIIRPDGTSPRQITKESFRLVTQPIWTPDSQRIIARKHFTSRRSLGAGEMWMYHISGKTDGLQLTAKQSEQKDTGEPALSPDGRYLYYSLDATGGSNFEYDKDGNPGIYAVDRLDLQTQETQRLIAGPGGACRPVPSPDGKSIAFVRRVRYTSTLFIMDLDSRRARPVYEGLERDNQETWAVHGVYPAMSWTPDGRSLAFWARGKLHRLDVSDIDHPAHAEIPFRVKATRKLAKAIRFPVEVAPDTFQVRVIRDAAVSPKGDVFYFKAICEIYTAPISSGTVGEPARLNPSGPEDEFEFFPAWSRDGRFIAFVAWNDDRLGSVRVIPAAGGPARTITTEPGHYGSLAFSPDGATLIYEKTGGGYITSPLWGRDPGIYAVDLAEARPAARLISRRGGSPHFGATSDRVFLTIRQPESDSDKVSLVSVPVNGSTPQNGERTHYRSDWAGEMRISPDGRYLAFAERYNVYLTPFLDAGKPVDIGPKSSSVPVVKLTTEAGSAIHWSGDSSALHWTLGPDLYSLAVKDSLAGSPFAPEPAVPAPTQPGPPVQAAKPASSTIKFTARQEIPTGRGDARSIIAITNIKILTMQDSLDAGAQARASRIIDQGVIVVEGNRIAAVGPASEVQVPAGATVIDGRGGVVTPGLIDVHAHGPQGENGITPQRNWSAHANLAFGVTTIHDPSNDTEMIFAAAELARTGRILAPRTFSTGTILYGAQGAFRSEIESLDDALFHLRRMKAAGAFSVKSYNQPRRDQRQMVLEAARRTGMMVVPEGGALYQHNMTMVVDGHTSVEHTMPVEAIYADAATLWGASRTGYTPTLGVAYGGMGGENYWYAKTNVWEDVHLTHFVPRYVTDPRSRRRTDAPDVEWNHIKAAQMAKRILDARAADAAAHPGAGPWGGPTLGAHGQLAGLAAHWEMWMLAQGGMTPFEALRAATIDGAWYIGLDKDIGSLAPGKLADLILFAKDPIQDIRNTASISQVMLNGRLYNAADLAQLAPSPQPGPAYFFEALQRGSSTTMALEAIMRQAAIDGGTCAGCQRGVH